VSSVNNQKGSTLKNLKHQDLHTRPYGAKVILPGKFHGFEMWIRPV